MKRLALVVQRYGEEINGGAELHARLLTERLAQRYEIEVLTSCARDYADWAMFYAPGPTAVHGVRVIRFSHPQRNDIGRAKVPLVHKLRFKLRGLLRRLPGPLVLPSKGKALYDGEDFLRRQGPHCAELFEHLSNSSKRYDAVIFFTALYEPSALGIRLWGQRSILVPLLHDEKPMYLPVFGNVLRAAGALLFNTESERRLAARMYGLDTSGAAIAGLGMEVRRPEPGAVAAVLSRHGLGPGYFVYVGRIDVAKGCRELIEAFTQHAQTNPTACLVLVGQAVMTVPQHPQIRCTGFVSDGDRDALIAGAAALVIPSRYESLSMVLLEAMLLRTPVIANAQCEVLADHIRISGAGSAYAGRRQLLAAFQAMSRVPAEERQRLGEAGTAYVQQHYDWARVMRVFDDVINKVTALPAR
jgi:glycosyltransferase involved in cell wall biosynthesis